RAWYKGNSARKYHQPGAKEPNALGIHDMLGNVAEWTFDQYNENYSAMLDHNPAVNPFMKPTELYPRAVRGGSWMDSAEAVSCLQRRGSDPSWKMRDPQLPKSLWWHTNAPFVG
ncbi:MAG: SUMF1/EgtB/PvdO family nonheme iron enzyme, partial [Aliifodinibius sp.]|nr:formylglycine-generating enzyme family protein [candidate division Zixibacteria bacterium]NIT61202.1 formylglycine-generating enzyme family protein [Fodinibius sp.]NIV15556.1 SUMF1/EgtB/PvdO family nonheme iron enzyme [Fodinibius sp.]NIY29782.1 SUMF1/EgtB/PvdO family nonheme iron enzyme [Fodinibius sp.]